MKMIHTNEHRVTSMAKERIEGFHREAAARQVARQALAGRSLFRFAAVPVRLPVTLAVRYIELPARKAALNMVVRFFELVSRMTGATQEASS